MVKYLYLKCKCGRIGRVLAYSADWNKVHCLECGEVLPVNSTATKEEYLRQHTINHRDPGEVKGVPREKTGMPIAKNTPRKETVPSTFWYCTED
jgi:ribosomal protein S27E